MDGMGCGSDGVGPSMRTRCSQSTSASSGLVATDQYHGSMYCRDRTGLRFGNRDCLQLASCHCLPEKLRQRTRECSCNPVYMYHTFISRARFTERGAIHYTCGSAAVEFCS